MAPKRKRILISSSSSSSSSSSTHSSSNDSLNKDDFDELNQSYKSDDEGNDSNANESNGETDDSSYTNGSDDNDEGNSRSKKRKSFSPRISILDLLRANYNDDDTPDAVKTRVITTWVRDIKPSMRRKFRPLAERIYDKITAIPKQSDILQSKMPFREKCALLEQMEMLGQCHPGTADYFAIKKDIFRIMSSYENMIDNAVDLERIDTEADKLQMDNVRDIPLRMKILRSDLSDHNKKVLLSKYDVMNTYCSDGNTYGKLYEWIEWGLSVSDKIIPIPVQISDGTLAVNKYLYGVKSHLDRKLYGMTSIKETLLELLATRITNPNTKELSIGLLGAPGVGKCLDPNTLILLYGGDVVRAKEVKVGDKLIGDDNEPRTVLSVCNGEDVMYEINTPYNGSFIVNEPHVLTLRNPKTFDIVDIPLNEYLKCVDTTPDKYIDYTMFSVPIKYKMRCIPDDSISLIAIKICKTLIDLNFGIELPCVYVCSDYRLRHGIIKQLITYGRKPIKVNNKTLANQLLFMCRSIGINAMLIVDNVNSSILLDIMNGSEIDNIKDDDITSIPFTVKKLGRGPYCGFTLDGNGRFILENCVITHNTHLVQVLAESISLPFYKINMGGHADSHQFLGHGFTYEGAQPGIIVKGLRQMKSKSGVIYLDEFDKIASQSGKVEHTFLHISDPIQQADFQDHYMPEIKIDLSYMMFIYSFNYKESINPILLDRIPIIEVPGYSAKEKFQIVRSFIIPEALQNIGMTPDQVKFTDDAINYVIGSHHEEGMRRVKQDIQHLIKRINMMNACTHPDGMLKLSYEIKDFKLPFTVNADIVRKLEHEKKKEKYLDLYL